MPKVISFCNYLKNAAPPHLTNNVNYISTHEGMERLDNACGLLSATVRN